MSDLVSIGSPIQSGSKENHDTNSNGFENDKNCTEKPQQISLNENGTIDHKNDSASIKLNIKMSNDTEKQNNDPKLKNKHNSSRKSKHSNSQEKSSTLNSKDRNSSSSQRSTSQENHNIKKSNSSNSKDRKSSSHSKHHSDSKDKSKKHKHEKKSHHNDRDKTPKRDRKDSRSDKKENSSSLCKEPKSLNGNRSDDESNAGGGSSKQKSSVHKNKSSTSDKSKSSSNHHKNNRKDNGNKEVVDKPKDKSYKDVDKYKDKTKGKKDIDKLKNKNNKDADKLKLSKNKDVDKPKDNSTKDINKSKCYDNKDIVNKFKDNSYKNGDKLKNKVNKDIIDKPEDNVNKLQGINVKKVDKLKINDDNHVVYKHKTLDVLNYKTSISESPSSSNKNNQIDTKKDESLPEEESILPIINQSTEKKETRWNNFRNGFITNDEEDAANVLLAMSTIPYFEGNEVITENIIFVENTSSTETLSSNTTTAQLDVKEHNITKKVQSDENDLIKENVHSMIESSKKSPSCNSIDSISKEYTSKINDSCVLMVVDNESCPLSCNDVKLANTNSEDIASEHYKQTEIVVEDKDEPKTSNILVEKETNMYDKTLKENKLINDSKKIKSSNNENENSEKIVLSRVFTPIDVKSLSTEKTEQVTQKSEDKIINTVNTNKIISTESTVDIKNHDGNMMSDSEEKLNETKQVNLVTSQNENILDKKNNTQISVIIDNVEKVQQNSNLNSESIQITNKCHSNEILEQKTILNIFPSQIDSNKKGKRKNHDANHDYEVKKLKLSNSNESSAPIIDITSKNAQYINEQNSICATDIEMKDSDDTNKSSIQLLHSKHENKLTHIYDNDELLNSFNGFSHTEAIPCKNFERLQNLINILQKEITNNDTSEEDDSSDHSSDHDSDDYSSDDDYEDSSDEDNDDDYGFKGFTYTDIRSCESRDIVHTQLIKLKDSLNFKGFSENEAKICYGYEFVKHNLEHAQKQNYVENQQKNIACGGNGKIFNETVTRVYENNKDNDNEKEHNIDKKKDHNIDKQEDHNIDKEKDHNVDKEKNHNTIKEIDHSTDKDSNKDIVQNEVYNQLNENFNKEISVHSPTVNNNNHDITASNHWVVEQEMKYKLLPVKVKLERLFEYKINSKYILLIFKFNL